jgi:raffinose/stachyose/melibiose transport system substrate-binding protein
MFKRSTTAKLAALTTTAAVVAGLTGCSSSSSDDAEGTTFTVWQFEDKASANYIAWQEAVDIFEEQHPGVTVNEVTTSFDNIRKNGKLLLDGDDVPDVIEFNKGNADGGQLAAQGLLTNLNDQVEERGWDDIVTGSMQNLAKYDENGNAGPDGDWFGVPNSGQYYLVYYNKDMFDAAGIPLPTSQAELTDALQAFMNKGQVPISANAGEFGLLQMWWQLVSSKADRQTIDDYMFLQGDPDFSTGAFADGAQELQDWIDKGYLGDQLGAITQDQMKQAFIAQKFPIMMNGSWEFTSVKDSAEFNWGTIAIPGAEFNEGLTGQLWGVPAGAKNKDLAYDWIDITLGQQVQDKIGELGGLPLLVNADAITDPQTLAFTQSFEQLKNDDKLSYFPDYPVTGLYEFLVSELQAMANGTRTADEFDENLQKFYDDGKEALVNG